VSDHIRILIADDHPIVRQGLSDLLIPRNGMEVVGEARNGREAVDLARELQPDVIVMDLIMPELSGAAATAQITAENPAARVLILTSFGNEDILGEAIHAGALGCLLKDSQPEDLLQAIRSVDQGQLTIPQNLALKLIKRPSNNAPTPSLTSREQEVMAAVAEGLSNKEIGQLLNIGANTVRSHISSILRKLDLSNRTQLAIYAKDHADHFN
jgi:NarL family two-component system response regulator LiaR